MASDSNSRAGLYLIVGGGGLIAAGIKRFNRKRRFEDTPSIDIGSAPQGQVELTGFAWAKSLLHNLEGRPMAYAGWKIEKQVNRGKQTSWEIVLKGSFPDGFLVQDNSGAAWVDMSNADLEGSTKVLAWSRMSAEARNQFLTWLGPRNINSEFPPTNGFFSGTYRVSISEISIGCPVVAQGNFYTGRKESVTVLSGLEIFKEKFKKLTRNPAYALALLDADSNGVVDEEEQRTGYAIAAQSTARSVANGNNVVSMRTENVELLGHLIGSDSNKVVVANTHETYLIKRLTSWTPLMIVGGAIMIAAGVCALASEWSR